MDDFAFQQELDALAGNASDPDPGATEPIVQTAARWQKLFGLPQDEAIERIVEHRNSLTGVLITDEHWETIRTEKEGGGYDREAYEYEVNLQRKKGATRYAAESPSCRWSGEGSGRCGRP